jgi:hypothetical protein
MPAMRTTNVIERLFVEMRRRSRTMCAFTNQKTQTLLLKLLSARSWILIANFQHVNELRKVFQLAGVDYGRIDYGVCHGRIQVWEINTNPVIIPRREKIDPRRLPAQSRSARQVTEALELLSRRHETGEAFPFRAPEFLKHKTIQFFHRFLRCRRRK